MFLSFNITLPENIVDAVRQSLQAPQRTNTEEGQDGEGGEFLAESHVGVFAGIILLPVYVTTIIVFYFLNNKGSLFESVVMYHTVDIASHVAMIVTVCLAIYYIFKLRFIVGQVNSIDQVLMFVSAGGLMLFEIFIMVSAFHLLNNDHDLVTTETRATMALDGTSSVVSISQTLLQTCFILEGLQRHADQVEQQRAKSGRGAIAFLILSNVGLWLYKSFIGKKVMLSQHQEYYGDLLWPIVVNLCLPLEVFYRFHSSVCLAHIWSAAYKPREKQKGFHLQQVNGEH